LKDSTRALDKGYQTIGASYHINRTTNQSRIKKNDAIENDILKNNSMVNLAAQSKNLSRDRTVNPVMKRKNKLMGLESLNDINY
jgi:hypothetical protein